MLLEKVKGQNKMDKAFLALGTINNIKVFNSSDEYIVSDIIERVFEIDDRMSAFKQGSDITKINRNAGKKPQTVHRETFELIKKAFTFSLLSDGTFDITIRPLVELWGINKKECFVPSDSEISNKLGLVNYKDILLDEKSCSVMLKKEGQSLDLGSIAKGYAADEARRILEQNHIKSAIVNLGGNIAVLGKRPDSRPWQIGIQNPLASTGEYLGVLTAVNKTIVTSGCNERFFIKDGIRYHHILIRVPANPRKAHC